MKPLLRLLSCQRQMTALAIQTGKRFPRRESSMQMQTIQYIAIKFHELIFKKCNKIAQADLRSQNGIQRKYLFMYNV